MKRAEKVQVVSELTDTLKEAKSTVFVNFVGLTVKEQQDLKKKLREAKSTMVVAKNTLIKLAGTQAKYPEEVLTDTVLTQQTGVVTSNEDPIAFIQVLGKYIKANEKPKFKAGIVDGRFVDADGLLRLSNLPGKEVLYAQVVGGMSAPLYGLVGTLQGNIQKLLWILKSKAQV